MVNWLSVAEDASRPAVSICIRVLHRQSTTILYSHFVGAHFILNVLQTRYLTQTRRHIVSTVLKIQLKIPENSGRTQPTGGIQTRSSVRVWYLDNFCFLIILIVTSRHEAKCFGSRVKCSHEFYFTDANFRYLKGLIESCGEVGGGIFALVRVRDMHCRISSPSVADARTGFSTPPPPLFLFLSLTFV